MAIHSSCLLPLSFQLNPRSQRCGRGHGRNATGCQSADELLDHTPPPEEVASSLKSKYVAPQKKARMDLRQGMVEAPEEETRPATIPEANQVGPRPDSKVPAHHLRPYTNTQAQCGEEMANSRWHATCRLMVVPAVKLDFRKSWFPYPRRLLLQCNQVGSLTIELRRRVLQST